MAFALNDCAYDTPDQMLLKKLHCNLFANKDTIGLFHEDFGDALSIQPRFC
jgi:hypothetical protein